LLWHRFPSWLIGQRITLKRVTFDHPEPVHSAEYRLMFPCPIHFDQPETCLVFDAGSSPPLVQTAETLAYHLQRAPVDWFTRPAYYPVYTRRVLDHLENIGDLAKATIQSTASELHLTERTLRRKLLAEGSKFQKLKDGVRRDMAIHYLSQTSMSINQTSQQLGFRTLRHSPGPSANGLASYPELTATQRSTGNDSGVQARRPRRLALDPLAVTTRALASPLLERAMECTGFLKTALRGNVADAGTCLAQQLQRHTAAHFVLDLLKRTPHAPGDDARYWGSYASPPPGPPAPAIGCSGCHASVDTPGSTRRPGCESGSPAIAARCAEIP
jgi:AraC-like DNA-binding protein